jgi:hypothetical protein
VYTTQDYEGKAAILKVILKSVTLRGEEADFVWHEPFDIMFSIGELVLSRKKWGPSGVYYRTLKPYIEFVRHNDLALQLQPIQNYLEKSA